MNREIEYPTFSLLERPRALKSSPMIIFQSWTLNCHQENGGSQKNLSGERRDASDNRAVPDSRKFSQPEFPIPTLASGPPDRPSRLPATLTGQYMIDRVTHQSPLCYRGSLALTGLWSLGRDATSVRRRQRADVIGRVL